VRRTLWASFGDLSRRIKMKSIVLLFLLILIGQLFCQLDFYIETDETTYSYGQDIYITFNVHNTSNDTITVAFSNTAPFLYYIDGETFYPPSMQVVTYVTFTPDSLYSLIHLHIYDVAVGDHEITSEFYTIPNIFTADPIYFTVESVEANNDELQFVSYQLSNFPNPFNPSTTINFSIKKDSNVEITIYNIRGQKIKTLTHNVYTKGSHSIIWNGEDESGNSVNSGIYYSKLKVNGKTKAVNKCLMLK